MSRDSRKNTRNFLTGLDGSMRIFPSIKTTINNVIHEPVSFSLI